MRSAIVIILVVVVLVIGLKAATEWDYTTRNYPAAQAYVQAFCATDGCYPHLPQTFNAVQGVMLCQQLAAGSRAGWTAATTRNCLTVAGAVN